MLPEIFVVAMAEVANKSHRKLGRPSLARMENNDLVFA